MKKLLLIVALLSPMLLIAQGDAPKKNKVGVDILHPLANERNDFERNLAQHNKEFHTGQGAVDIYEVLVGNHTGEYHFVFRNPNSWAGVETAFKASNDKSHAADWDMNVAKHLSGNSPFFIYEVSDDSYMSSNPADMQSELMGLYLIDINPGMEEDFFSALKKIKEMYQKSNSHNYYIVQTSAFDKGTQVVVVFPLAKGWASFEPDPNAAWDKMFKAAFPKEDFKAFLKKFNSSQKTFESMVVKHRQDLSSPM
ncbi:MAG: hypothetical protein M3015_01355 [Bacteroidota bacterium]|nr:hypothetical protein [Bacteroidota bacterium]